MIDQIDKIYFIKIEIRSLRRKDTKTSNILDLIIDTIQYKIICKFVFHY